MSNQVYDRISGAPDFPRKTEVLELVRSNDLKAARVLLGELKRAVPKPRTVIAPNVARLHDTPESILLQDLEYYLEDVIDDSTH